MLVNVNDGRKKVGYGSELVLNFVLTRNFRLGPLGKKVSRDQRGQEGRAAWFFERSVSTMPPGEFMLKWSFTFLPLLAKCVHYTPHTYTHK